MCSGTSASPVGFVVRTICPISVSIYTSIYSIKNYIPHRTLFTKPYVHSHMKQIFLNKQEEFHNLLFGVSCSTKFTAVARARLDLLLYILFWPTFPWFLGSRFPHSSG